MLGQASRKMDAEGAVEGQAGRRGKEGQQHQWWCEVSMGTCPIESVPLKMNRSGLVEPPFDVNSRVARMACNRLYMFVF